MHAEQIHAGQRMRQPVNHVSQHQRNSLITTRTNMVMSHILKNRFVVPSQVVANPGRYVSQITVSP